MEFLASRAYTAKPSVKVDGTSDSLQDSFAQRGLTNLGLKDIKVALEWIQANINSFRGDPTKVSDVAAKLF